MMRKNRGSKRHSESGSSLIEVAIAGVVLTVGMLAIMALLAIAIRNNGKSKIDTTATMLSQAVTEQISAVLAGGGPGSLTDCNGSGTTWAISSATGGATLTGSSIDFTKATPSSGYYMNYNQCDPNGNTVVTYDVRWNIQTVDSGGTFLVTVGARPKGSSSKFVFSVPVNMRAYVGGS